MLTNMVSPPTAGTSFAHRMVAIGGSAPKTATAGRSSGAKRRGLLIVPKFNQLGRFFLIWSEGMNGQLAKTPAKVDQIFGRDILVAKDEELVLDQRVLDGVGLLV